MLFIASLSGTIGSILSHHQVPCSRSCKPDPFLLEQLPLGATVRSGFIQRGRGGQGLIHLASLLRGASQDLLTYCRGMWPAADSGLWAIWGWTLLLTDFKRLKWVAFDFRLFLILICSKRLDGSTIFSPVRVWAALSMPGRKSSGGINCVIEEPSPALLQGRKSADPTDAYADLQLRTSRGPPRVFGRGVCHLVSAWEFSLLLLSVGDSNIVFFALGFIGFPYKKKKEWSKWRLLHVVRREAKLAIYTHRRQDGDTCDVTVVWEQNIKARLEFCLYGATRNLEAPVGTCPVWSIWTKGRPSTRRAPHMSLVLFEVSSC